MPKIPGSNLLNKALTVIAAQNFQYLAFTGNTLNDIGQEVPSYAPAIPLRGSAQPPNKELMEHYGLLFNQNPMVFFVSKSMLDVTRDSAGDHIAFAGKRWQVLYKTDWYMIDGWIQIITTEIKGCSSAC